MISQVCQEQPRLSPGQETRLKALAATAARLTIVPIHEAIPVFQEMAMELLFRVIEFGLDRIEGRPFINKTSFQLTQLVYACTGKKSGGVLLEWAHQSFTPYLQETVVPRLSCKTDEPLLSAFVWAWENHKVMTLWVQPAASSPPHPRVCILS